jgi:hypothetical protein
MGRLVENLHTRPRLLFEPAKEPTVSHRVNVGVNRGADASALTSALKQAGAESVRGPSAELPDVLVVDLPADTDPETFLRQAQQLPGVRYAERDSWQFSQ